MKERSLAFRPDKGLIGVLGQPKLKPPQRLPTVIFLNAGLIHRVGPYRLHVDLARKLAGFGFSSLRFDLSGIGDSRLKRDTSSYVDRTNDDIRYAMEAATSAGCSDQFVIFGLCTGARNAHNIAVADQRVRGAIMVDPYGYLTLGFRIHRVVPRIVDPRASVRFAARVFRKLRGNHLPIAQDNSPNPEQDEVFNREFPPRELTERQLEDLDARGAKLLFTYTGGAGEYFNHRSQFFSFFPSLTHAKNIEVQYLPETDHTFTCIHHRNEFIKLTSNWLRSSFGEKSYAP